MKDRIEKKWLEFSGMVMPEEAGQTQRTEMRRSFYAGAASLFETITRSLTPGQEPTDEDIAMLQGVHDELKAYFEALRRGEA